ncbi:MAG: hypothetical protein Kow0074_19980 [Candidatus Zixiibacteriota bacterium]
MVLALVTGLWSSGATGAGLRAVPKSVDFGYMPEGVKVHGHYWLVNDGVDTIHIDLIKPQCGCTTAPLTEDRIAPGDSINLEFSFNSANMHGWVHKLINIHYDDTAASPAKVYFSANVDEEYGAVKPSPVAVRFDDFDKTKEDIVLENTSADSFAVSLLSVPPPYLSYAFDRDTIPPGGRAILTLQVTDSVPLGLYQTSMTLYLDGRVPERISIPIGGTGYVR